MAPALSNIPERQALYYPYIQIRDTNWLKATVLCFGQVRRMLPMDFEPQDADDVRSFTQQRNEKGEPLLTYEPVTLIYDSPVVLAQERLLKVMQSNLEELQERFSEDAARKQGLRIKDTDLIHFYKIKYELWQFLEDNHLAWEPHKNASGGDKWIAMFPKLNEALMSTIAITIAKSEGLDIVTDNGHIHHALATLNEQEVFESLLNLTAIAPVVTPEHEVVDELAHVVFTTAFDLTKLTAMQIAELLKEGTDLRRFKSELVKFAKRIPDIHDPAKRQKRLEEVAEDVLKEWDKFKSSLKRLDVAIDEITGVGEIKNPEWIKKLFDAGATYIGTGTAATSALFGHPYAAVGIALGVVAYKATKVFRKIRSESANPYALLTHVERAGGLRIELPSRALALS